MDLQLTGSVAVVTGSNSGIRLAVARGLAEEGAHLMMCARNETRLQAAATTIKTDFPVRVKTVAADVATPDGVATLALAPGSYLAISHAVNDARPDYMARITAIYERVNAPFTPRDRAGVEAFFGDFVLEDPGLVNVWPYLSPPRGMDPELARTGYSAVARKAF
ncbi:SDR family NAD(P)-dependent oxidoreductase [Winogradskya humida]|uniref:Short subunit dehydrogenase n=1 Tax=Winogradskya humida TaxID=113566 RepID=A0ABQ3ZUF9_9ACTN|nr:SDR family NAD(P)-dependent oxidoreductase [Actinoplanes humidus]GIE22235.1 hypothetical protein Ahu01nite_053370 [Actinoplanes humidus]